MINRDELHAVADVLIDGRDFLADAIEFYGDVVAPEDREMVAALTQAVDFILASN